MEHVVRVQWGDGRVTEVSDGGTGRKRATTYARNDVSTAAQAVQVATVLLSTLGVRDSVTATVKDHPTVWPQLGDAYTAAGFDGATSTQRLVGRRVSWDRNGFAEVAPTLSSPEEQIDARQMLAVERTATGMTAGRSAGVQPLRREEAGTPSGVLRDVGMPDWSMSNLSSLSDADAEHGPFWKATAPTLVPKVILQLAPPDGWSWAGVAGSDPVFVSVEVDGVAARLMEIPDGELEWSYLTGLLIPDGAQVQPKVSLGDRTPSEWAQVRLTVQFISAPAALRVGK